MGVGGEAALYLLTMGDGSVLLAETGDDTAKMCRSMLYLWLQISRPVGFVADVDTCLGFLKTYQHIPFTTSKRASNPVGMIGPIRNEARPKSNGA